MLRGSTLARGRPNNLKLASTFRGEDHFHIRLFYPLFRAGVSRRTLGSTCCICCPNCNTARPRLKPPIPFPLCLLAMTRWDANGRAYLLFRFFAFGASFDFLGISRYSFST